MSMPVKTLSAIDQLPVSSSSRPHEERTSAPLSCLAPSAEDFTASFAPFHSYFSPVPPSMARDSNDTALETLVPEYVHKLNLRIDPFGVFRRILLLSLPW
jgi:hypothetical protein